MPKLTITKDGGVTQVGPLAATTDFMVRSGVCYLSLENPGAVLDQGFEVLKGGTWSAGTGKTLYLTTTAAAEIYYGELGA